MALSTYLIALITLIFLYVLKKLSARTSAPYPSGPKALPIIGNVFDMPSQGKDWLTYAEWGRKYGGICMIHLFGQPIIIVNSAEAMQQMEKSPIYSDRPHLEMCGELVGYAKTIVIMPYGQKFRNFRKYFSRIMGSPSQLKQYLPMGETESRKFIKRIFAKPRELEPQLRKLAGSIIMKLSYGITVQEGEDPFVTMIEHANDNFNIATTPGKFLVDVIPPLKYVPEWVPGAGFQRLAREWRKAFDDMVEVPYAYSKKMMMDGVAPASFVSTSLENEASLSPSDLDDVKHVAASMYGAGADTTVSAEHAFFLAMLLFPEVQQKAQEEIDAIIGGDRLPTCNDREHLPYIQAVVTEVLRWHNVAPLGVPHRASEDGIIEGYLVPKGSIIIANLWAMLHDPEVYPEPMVFDPTRHIATPSKEVQRDPRHACFGFGRRICPGMHLAEASLYMIVAMSLAVFKVRPVIRNGAPVLPEHENTDGTISHQKPFEYILEPRSEKAVALIRRETADL